MESTAEGDVGAVAERTRVLWWGFADPSLHKLATSLGTSEQARRLIISIFLASCYRHCLFHKDSYLIHLVHAFMDLTIAYFNFGNQLYHSLLCMVLQFLILRLMGCTITVCSLLLFPHGLPSCRILLPSRWQQRYQGHNASLCSDLGTGWFGC